MRIYEFARAQKSTSKELLAALKKGGFSGLTHMSVLTDDARAFLEQRTGAKTPPAPPEPPKPSQPVVPSKQKKPTVISEIEVSGQMPLHEVATRMGRQSGELIVALLKQGVVCNRNHMLSPEVIISLAEGFGLTVQRKAEPKKELKPGTVVTGKEESRYPVVVIMGHVDHGKTTLLDYIRKTNIAAREAGGITQQLGAYEVDSNHGKVVFLDTPGHAAFTHMRARGTQVTDLVVLVVAADDGIMPQTQEAIDCAKAAGVPIIVAINKIDKLQSAAGVETIKRQLAERDLLPEDWGGQTVCVPISAKTGKGVEELLEMIVLAGQLLELKAYPQAPLKAAVLESHLEKGHGPVASVIVRQGTLKVGDYFMCGGISGKVRLLIDSFGKNVAQAGPSIPVQVIGFDALPAASEHLEVVSYDHYLKLRSGKGIRSAPSRAFAQEAGERMIHLMVKGDTFGSIEALEASIAKLNRKKPEGAPTLSIIAQGVGDVTRGDVDMAIDVGARIICMSVKVERNAALHAKESGVPIVQYQVIYHLLEDLEALQEKGVKKKRVEKMIGELVVRKVFDVKGLGVIAGCYVQTGLIKDGAKAVCLRRNEYIGEGNIKSLQRERKTVKEVKAGAECGFIVSGFSDWQVDDTVQVFATVEQ